MGLESLLYGRDLWHLFYNMPSLSLKADEVAGLQDATRILLGPLNHHDTDEWRAKINRVVGDLLGADQRTFRLHLPGIAPVYSDQFQHEALREYEELIGPLERRFGLTRRLISHRVCNRGETWGPWIRWFYRSAYYNEFLVPLRAYDTLVAAVPTADGGTAQLAFNHDQPRGRRFGRRGRAILALLSSAFEAGVWMLERAVVWPGQLADVVDDLGDGVLLYDDRENLVHMNGRGRELLGLPGVGRRIELESRRLARTAARAWERRSRDDLQTHGTGPFAGRVATSEGPVRLVASLAPDVGPRAGVVLTLKGPDQPIDFARRARRYGLTNRQVEVAALLADRMTNDEIATRLELSPHTVRHHTERVLRKLEISSRTQVRKVLGGHRFVDPAATDRDPREEEL